MGLVPPTARQEEQSTRLHDDVAGVVGRGLGQRGMCVGELTLIRLFAVAREAHRRLVLDARVGCRPSALRPGQQQREVHIEVAVHGDSAFPGGAEDLAGHRGPRNPQPTGCLGDEVVEAREFTLRMAHVAGEGRLVHRQRVLACGDPGMRPVAPEQRHRAPEGLQEKLPVTQLRYCSNDLHLHVGSPGVVATGHRVGHQRHRAGLRQQRVAAVQVRQFLAEPVELRADVQRQP